MKFLKKLLINFSLIIFSIIITLLFAEFVLRLTPYKNIGRIDYAYPRHYFMSDPILRLDIAPNMSGKTHHIPDYSYPISSNSYGCFDYEREVADDYMLFVGDSYTWGYADLEHKWTTLLEEKTRVFSMKCGVTHTGTKHQLLKAKKTIGKVGHNPKYIVLLYVGNDLNDDFTFESLHEARGFMIDRTKSIDLKNGKIEFMSDEEILAKVDKRVADNFSGILRKIRYSSVLYRVYKKKMKPNISAFKKRFAKKQEVEISGSSEKQALPIMPEFTSKGQYSVDLMYYTHQRDLAWYNNAIADHKNNLAEFAIYAASIGAKFILIDAHSHLKRPRFADLVAFLNSYPNSYYYDLMADYKEQSTWPNDGHWDIKGNKEAAQYIYQHFQKLGVFK